ncbi:uncharacterized protein [Diadema setosum]|uniref:uncharacterized protein n=1 Tax=Diadema setosum TaxID=31175 RepID=UPI003B3BA4E9
MAKPVRTRVDLGVDDIEAGIDAAATFPAAASYVVSFYVPHKEIHRLQGLPRPLDERIYIHHEEPGIYYALTFGGFPIGSRVYEQVRAFPNILSVSLRNATNVFESISVDVFDSPMKLTNRHNEILVPARSTNRTRQWCTDGVEAAAREHTKQ